MKKLTNLVLPVALAGLLVGNLSVAFAGSLTGTDEAFTKLRAAQVALEKSKTEVASASGLVKQAIDQMVRPQAPRISDDDWDRHLDGTFPDDATAKLRDTQAALARGSTQVSTAAQLVGQAIDRLSTDNRSTGGVRSKTPDDDAYSSRDDEG
jgi:hypothetical protein